MKSKRIGSFRKFLSPSKKDIIDDDLHASTGKEGVEGRDCSPTTPKSEKKLRWSPEQLINKIEGVSIPETLRGTVFLIEVGDIERGWILDFSGDDEMCGSIIFIGPPSDASDSDEPEHSIRFDMSERLESDLNKICVDRYDDLDDRPTNKKGIPSGPPEGTYTTNGGDKVEFETLPWKWYKDRKTFSKIEDGKLTDMVAFMTGKMAITGDACKWQILANIMADAKQQLS